MATADFKRKLTAVFSADVVGYSRLMGENEAETVKTCEAQALLNTSSPKPARETSNIKLRIPK